MAGPMTPDPMTAVPMMPDPMIRGRGVPTTRSVLTIRGRTGPTTSPFHQTISSRSGPLRRTISRRTGRFRQAISSRILRKAGQLIRCLTVAISRTTSRSQGRTSRRIRRLQIETGRTSARGSRAATLLHLRSGQRSLSTTLRLNRGRSNVRSARHRLHSKTASTRRLLNSGRRNVKSARRLPRSRTGRTTLRRNVHNRSTKIGRRLRHVHLSSHVGTQSLRRRQDRSRTTSQIKNRRRTRKTRSPTRA